jgi:hypothetical protein
MIGVRRISKQNPKRSHKQQVMQTLMGPAKELDPERNEFQIKTALRISEIYRQNLTKGLQGDSSLSLGLKLTPFR